jgi:hypothetical protein
LCAYGQQLFEALVQVDSVSSFEGFQQLYILSETKEIEFGVHSMAVNRDALIGKLAEGWCNIPGTHCRTGQKQRRQALFPHGFNSER